MDTGNVKQSVYELELVGDAVSMAEFDGVGCLLRCHLRGDFYTDSVEAIDSSQRLA